MSKVVEAEQFVLKDSEGKIRAELSMSKTVASIWLEEAKKEAPTLRLYDENGNVRVELTLLKSLGPMLYFYDEKSKVRLEIYGGSAQQGWNTPIEYPFSVGGPAIRVRDEEQHTISHFGFNGVILTEPNELQLLWLNSKTREILKYQK